MNKSFCDVCKGEIKGGSLYGGFMRQKKYYTLEGTMARGTTVDNTAPIIPEAFDLCEECQKKVWEFIEGIKKDGEINNKKVS